MIVRVDELQLIKAALDAMAAIDDDLDLDTHFKLSKALKAVEEIEQRYEESVKKSSQNIAKRREEDPTYGRSKKQLESRGKPKGSIKGVPRGWYKPNSNE